MSATWKVVTTFALYVAMVLGIAYVTTDTTLIIMAAFVGVVPMIVVVLVIVGLES